MAEREKEMTDDVIQRVLGQLEAGIQNLTINQQRFREEQRADNKQLFDKINDLAINGCAIGKKHSIDIDELKRRPERVIGIGAAVVSILAFLGSIALWVAERIR